jgi:hypothetical protein
MRLTVVIQAGNRVHEESEVDYILDAIFIWCLCLVSASAS